MTKIFRIYQPGEYHSQSEVVLSSDAMHHLTRVLRAKINDPLILFNGDGLAFHAKITAITKNQCVVAVSGPEASITTANQHTFAKIHLLQSIAKGEKMDWIIQKAVELGVASITPLYTRYGEVKLAPERSEKKMEHWKKIIISACEQCGKNTLPSLHSPIALPSYLNSMTRSETYIVLDPTASQTFHELTTTTENIFIFIGPEGGFSIDEIKLFENHSVVNVRLGPRILRTETAAISAIAIAQMLWGDF